MTCNEGFVPYCCGAFLSDRDEQDGMRCEEGRFQEIGILVLRSENNRRVAKMSITLGPGPVASLEECETPEMVRRRVGGACVQVDVSQSLVGLSGPFFFFFFSFSGFIPWLIFFVCGW
jgi:hypothetical protein